MNLIHQFPPKRSFPIDIYSNSLENPPCKHIRVKLFGKFDVWIDDQKLEVWTSKRAKYLLAYLLLNHQKPQSRDILIEHFWPHSTPDTARNSLNVAIHAIRKAFRAIDSKTEFLVFKHDHYAFHSDIQILSDIDIFCSNWRQGKYLASCEEPETITHYETSLQVYQGIFMEENLYDKWAETQRNYLQEGFLNILDHLSQHYLSTSNHERCIDLCEQILRLDECREDVYRRLMQVYVKQGKRSQAIRQYHRCVENLNKELDIAPTSDTRTLYLEIKECVH